VHGNWIFGAIELVIDEKTHKYRTGKFFATVVHSRTEVNLKKIIEEHIAPGSIIYSDMFASYQNIAKWKWIPPIPDGIEEYRYMQHQVVCHDHEFKAADGTNTNGIEGYWRVSKDQIPRKHFCDEEVLQEHLFVQMWRSRWRGNLFEGLLETLSRIRFSVDASMTWQIGRDANGIPYVIDWELNEATAKDNKVTILECADV